MNITSNNSFKHSMPYGIDFLTNELVRVRFYAPQFNKVELFITNKNLLIPMYKLSDGFFELFSNKLSHGDLYKFVLNGNMSVPDPVSRFQHKDVHSESVIVNPGNYNWEKDSAWRGFPLSESIIYELHVGTFSEEGTFKGVESKLDYLQDLGVNTIELMPVADFSGERSWGYDGVLMFAPSNKYGSPDDLKDLIKAAHKKGMMVLLDVVYNHFGPDGNYIYTYAKDEFFTSRYSTPWGNAINFSNSVVRDFYINNAIYWLKEYRFDGLRFDAVQTIMDKEESHILYDIVKVVKDEFNGIRRVHLILENGENESRYLKSGFYSAQWNDDFHHSIHVAATGETEGYYCGFSSDTTGKPSSYYIAKTIAEGFAYQGEQLPFSPQTRGEPSSHLAPSKFINFIQNHDQIGNRAFGERISKLVDKELLKAAVCTYILSPSVPMLFMGEEWCASSPFLYFCDYDGFLAEAVNNGRKEEFKNFSAFQNPEIRDSIPDATSVNSFYKSKLNHNERDYGFHKDFFEYYKKLLALRKQHIIPLIKRINQLLTSYTLINDSAFEVNWCTKDMRKLVMLANWGTERVIVETPSSDFLIASSKESSSSKSLGAYEVNFYIL